MYVKNIFFLFFQLHGSSNQWSWHRGLNSVSVTKTTTTTQAGCTQTPTHHHQATIKTTCTLSPKHLFFHAPHTCTPSSSGTLPDTFLFFSGFLLLLSSCTRRSCRCVGFSFLLFFFSRVLSLLFSVWVELSGSFVTAKDESCRLIVNKTIINYIMSIKLYLDYAKAHATDLSRRINLHNNKNVMLTRNVIGWNLKRGGSTSWTGENNKSLQERCLMYPQCLFSDHVLV